MGDARFALSGFITSDCNSEGLCENGFGVFFEFCGYNWSGVLVDYEKRRRRRRHTAVDANGGQAEVALVGKVATACITSGGRKGELYHGRGEEGGEEEEGT